MGRFFGSLNVSSFFYISSICIFVYLFYLFILMLCGQVLRVLDYSRCSRHVLSTAGDDGSVHLWDTTGRSPKVCNMTFLFLFRQLK